MNHLNQVVRDPIRTKEYYDEVIGQHKINARYYLKHNNPSLNAFVARYYLGIALAKYSAGYPIYECLKTIEEAVNYHISSMEAREYKFGGKGVIFNYLELYSAAQLAGRSQDLITALKKCKYTEKTSKFYEYDDILIEQFIDLLDNKMIDIREGQMERLEKLDKRWPGKLTSLPMVFKAVSHKDLDASTIALETYLIEDWSRSVEKEAKHQLKQIVPSYSGKWCFFAAGMCKQLGNVPNKLSKKAQSYIPIELLGV